MCGRYTVTISPETAAEKPAFRSSLKSKRCLVAADGFYEWKRTPDGKSPHLIRFKDRRAFALAGLWARWVSSDGEDNLEMFAVSRWVNSPRNDDERRIEPLVTS